MARRNRPDLPHRKGPVLDELRAAREAMLGVMAGTRPFGPAYKAADAVKNAVDAFATLLTGDPEHFWAKGTTGVSRVASVKEEQDEVG